MKAKEFIPREHGAWAMWIVPMLSSVLVTHFSLGFLALFLCFTLLYVAHHPVATLAKRQWVWQEGEKKMVAALALPAMAIGIVLVWIYDLPWLLLFGGLELVLFAFSVKTFVDREQRSFFNELMIVAALTLSAPASYYTITHAIDARAVMLYVLNFLFFGSSIFYVKMKIGLLRTKGVWAGDAGRARTMAIVYHVSLVVIIALMSWSGEVGILMLIGFLPMLAQIASTTLSRRTSYHRMNFTRIGIVLVVQSVIFLFAVGLFLK